MKYYIIAGEASGDLHGSNLMLSIKSEDPNADFRCWGGDLMESQGGKLVKHYRELSFMGMVDVIHNIGQIMRNFKLCKNDLLQYQPDVMVLIDYPGFNLRMAEFARKNGLLVYYYISPQIWAWKESRVHKIKKFVDRMFVILPFEKNFYEKYNFNVDFVGHPLLDEMSHYKSIASSYDEFVSKSGLTRQEIIAFLPGSRKQEIKVMLTEMMNLCTKFREYQFVIAGAPSVPESFYSSIIADHNIKIVFGSTYDLLFHASAALVTSGTATLEAALLDVPQIVCYKGGKISYYLAKKLIKVKYISLVNLIMEKEVVREMVQDDFVADKLTDQLTKILFDRDYREAIKMDYSELRKKLGGSGASQRAAQLMVSGIKETKI